MDVGVNSSLALPRPAGRLIPQAATEAAIQAAAAASPAALAAAAAAAAANSAVCPTPPMPSREPSSLLEGGRIDELTQRLEDVKRRRDHLGRESPILTALVIVGLAIMLLSLRMIPIYFPVFLPGFSIGLVIFTMSGVFLKIQDDALEAQQADIERQIRECG